MVTNQEGDIMSWQNILRNQVEDKEKLLNILIKFLKEFILNLL